MGTMINWRWDKRIGASSKHSPFEFLTALTSGTAGRGLHGRSPWCRVRTAATLTSKDRIHIFQLDV